MPKGATIAKIVVGVLVGVIALLAILISTSFADVPYYELGFIKRKSTGSVNTEKVYTMGHYIIGPDYTFKNFQADAHFVTLANVAIFTSDRLEVWLTASYQYFLRKQELALLHRDYDLYYNDILKSNALDAFKAAATAYSTDELIENRGVVEAALFKGIRERLGGVCCEYDCEENGNCVAGCKSQTECQDADRGMYVNVEYFQMLSLSIPSDLSSRYLRSIILMEETEKASLEQESTLVQKQTDAIVEGMNNKAKEIHQNATAFSELILAQAHANSTATVERARSQGLKDLYTRLGLSNEDYKSSFDYLRTIKSMENAHLSIDFNQLIAGNF